MPTTWNPWSQNAKQKRLITGLPEKKGDSTVQFLAHSSPAQTCWASRPYLHEANFALYADCLTKVTP